jgi:hypothetical protein
VDIIRAKGEGILGVKVKVNMFLCVNYALHMKPSATVKAQLDAF